MATKTKKVAKKATSKASNDTNVVTKINKELVKASIATINTVVDNSEKWQKLASKLIKKSEKVREQQIHMIFDTAEAVKGQFVSGTDKMKDLVGIDADLVEKAKDMAINNPVSRKVVGIVEDITEKVSENPMVQKAEKVSEDIKNMGMAKFNELKGDVLEQASKIIDKGEAIIEDAKEAPKAKVAKKVTKKAVATKKTVLKKATATATKATKVVAKAAPKKTVAKKTTATKKAVTKAVTKAAPKAKATVAKKTTAVKKATVKKVAEVKKEGATKVAEAKTEAKK
ncbi:hypothetical protein Q4512_05035 [Oceanihabitans sp. 2_MG-2023]|uniref:hypothetical protein n=1 Tax=Oceanihabitans sp. 2_MG-2023 TaxID=3062661 RepID=UPI0026E2A35D|nr:hypothetical protein [Oceanihabitans sp. 2_MG-2023]MDO6596269.1 hypothetical protein [Oceanihabitans sp. 2_MG-2023]